MRTETKQDVICTKCKAKMEKTGIMNSGNSVYEKYACKGCGNTQLKCTGLIK